MNPVNTMFAALAVVAALGVSADEGVWPKHSASELAIHVTLLRFRIHAEHCSAQLPELRAGFAGLVDDLNRRVQAISKGVLASDEFKGMVDKPVPAEIIEAFKDSFHDTQHNFERQEAASVCPKSLRNLGKVDDESLKSELTGTLKAVQNMTRNLEHE